MLDKTRTSLLLRACQEEAGAWEELAAVYRDWIHSLFLRCHLARQDADDLVQDVWTRLFKNLPKFKPDGQECAFRKWLRTIVVNRAREFWRAGKCRPQAKGGSDFQFGLEQIEDSASQLTALWEKEHNKAVLTRLLAVVGKEFAPDRMNAVCRLMSEQASATEIAAELKCSVGAVYALKSRVLKRLREVAEGLLD